MAFKKYQRVHGELRPVDEDDILIFKRNGELTAPNTGKALGVTVQISISKFDLDNGSPKIGDMIARNPDNYSDQWLVAEKYFKENFKI